MDALGHPPDPPTHNQLMVAADKPEPLVSMGYDKNETPWG
jgi:hypothetical protein